LGEKNAVRVIGAGLAGTEAAFQLAERGVAVELVEMKPGKRSPAHRSDLLGELVCSNSLRSDSPKTAIGLLHAELRRLGSLVLHAADMARIPAGEALAVDRTRFASLITDTIRSHPKITFIHEEATALPAGPRPVIVATGPLTPDSLAGKIAAITGERLYFYDAIAPIVDSASIDRAIAFPASRWGKGGNDYLNLPLSREQYYAFVAALLEGEKIEPRPFEEPKYFEGCLPIEVMAARGQDCLAFGPMKPVGLVDPRTGRRPFAVVQLRAEDAAGTAWNIVGFQTRLTWPEQQRIFRSLPGLERAEFLRLGQIHRNTFLESPGLVASDLSLTSEPHLFFAGQITGVEGYVESAASGLSVALSVLGRLQGQPLAPPPAETALGALWAHVTGRAHPPGLPYQPSNANFSLFAPLDQQVRKNERRAAWASRAQKAFERWMMGESLLASQSRLRPGAGAPQDSRATTGGSA
jgi:methylenetetrahydrofolate--tRNA-(uracil-5-)-methyltransferase